MGLTIHYKLQAGPLTLGQARKKVRLIAQRACELEFSVSQSVQLPCDDALGLDDERFLDLPGDECAVVRPRAGVGILVDLGPGCETASFGLARYPATIGRGIAKLPTGLSGWSWQAFCKTQYASDPRHGGVANFLRCHLGLVALLDFARQLGLLDSVIDEGGFWQRRDARALVEEAGEWNEMIAAFAGALKDAHGEVEGPIFSFPNFEPLEARGQKRLPKRYRR